jgi:MoaA/NifB/PqqE/SkfB family radical SAM enzyme
LIGAKKSMENMESTSKTFCPIPWNSLQMINNGDFRVCCNADHSNRIGTRLTDENGKVYNAGKDNWNDTRNAPLMKEVRKAMINGEWHEECTRCKNEESAGFNSFRIHQVNDWGKYFDNFSYEDALKVVSEDGTLDTDKQNIDFLDIRYGNFCNLKCRMCGPQDSHMWYSDWQKLHGPADFPDNDWYSDNPNYLQNFDKFGLNAQKINFIGGEPMLIKEHIESLKYIISANKAHTVRLSYNTNLTSISDEILELWTNFKEVRIAASIDGIDEVFNYQRFPANFKKVSKVIKTLDTHPKINFKLWFYFTVTNLNVFHFPEFMKWKLENNFVTWNSIKSPNPTVSYNMCHTPKHYSITILPKKIKDQLSQNYNEYIEWIKNTDYNENVKKDFIKKCNSIIKYMYSADDSQYVDSFVRITRQLDKIRNQNIVDVIPQYKDLFNGYS